MKKMDMVPGVIGLPSGGENMIIKRVLEKCTQKIRSQKCKQCEFLPGPQSPLNQPTNVKRVSNAALTMH